MPSAPTFGTSSFLQLVESPSGSPSPTTSTHKLPALRHKKQSTGIKFSRALAVSLRRALDPRHAQGLIPSSGDTLRKQQRIAYRRKAPLSAVADARP
ncbi:hypothetical protein TcBrA4_0096050 [Trypanosoma cruzi]|nr:hypothetical protein TcBrA4_0096050 [Trypanosoma cruzi]